MAVMKWDKGPLAERRHRVDDGLRALPGAHARAELLDTIETEIIPRLLVAHRDDPRVDACAATRAPPSEEEVAAFAALAVDGGLAAALAFVEARCREGLSLEQIFIALTAPAARLLGEQWLDDRRPFTEVTLGLLTLQQVVHVLGPSFAPTTAHRGLIVLCAAPGEQHTLGMHLTGEFLRRAGWGVQVSPSLTEDELVDLVSNPTLVMLGFTVSNDKLLAPLAALIARLRPALRDRATPILVGGAIALEAFAARAAVNVAGADPRDAVRYLEFHDKGGH